MRTTAIPTLLTASTTKLLFPDNTSAGLGTGLAEVAAPEFGGGSGTDKREHPKTVVATSNGRATDRLRGKNPKKQLTFAIAFAIEDMITKIRRTWDRIR